MAKPLSLNERWTEQEFADLVKVIDKRLELWDGHVIDMSYASPAHRRIVHNLTASISKKLKPPCELYTGEPIRPPKTTGVYREPDLAVICGEPKIHTIHGLEVTVNPVALVEVVSPESVRRDRNEKLDEYRRIPSLRVYLIVAQKSPAINQWTKYGDIWRETGAIGLSKSITLEINSHKIILPLKEIYGGVKFK